MSQVSFDDNTQPSIVDANEDLMICQVCYHRIEDHGNCPCVLAKEGGQQRDEKDDGRLCCFTEKRNPTPGDSPWEGDGRAVAPCFCRGTLGFAHQRCVFRAIRGWSVERCENCGFKYEDKITKLPISQVRYLICVSICEYTFHCFVIIFVFFYSGNPDRPTPTTSV